MQVSLDPKPEQNDFSKGGGQSWDLVDMSVIVIVRFSGKEQKQLGRGFMLGNDHVYPMPGDFMIA